MRTHSPKRCRVQGRNLASFAYSRFRVRPLLPFEAKSRPQAPGDPQHNADGTYDIAFATPKLALRWGIGREAQTFVISGDCRHAAQSWDAV